MESQLDKRLESTGLFPTISTLKEKLGNSPNSKVIFECENSKYRNIIGRMYFNALKYSPNFKMFGFAQEFKFSTDNIMERNSIEPGIISSNTLLELVDSKTRDLDDDNLPVYAFDIDFWGKKENIRVLKEIRKDGQQLHMIFSYEDE